MYETLNSRVNYQKKTKKTKQKKNKQLPLFQS